MNVHLIEKLLPLMSDGVLIADQACNVIAANDRAQALLGCSPGSRITQPALSAALAAAAEDGAVPPSCELATPGGAAVAATVVASAGVYLLVLKDGPAASEEILLHNVFGIVDRELRVPMEELSEVAGAVTRALIAIESGNDPEHIAVLMEIAVNVLDLRNATTAASRLRRIMSLAALYGDAPVCSSERIVLPELLGDVCGQMAGELREGGLSTAVEERPDGLPVIYGSRRWIFEAMIGVVRELVATAERGSRISIGIDPGDSRVLVRLRSNRTPGAHATADPQREVDLMIARRVVQMHGGKLRQRLGANWREIVLEMPAGAPAAADGEISNQQAERYAQDIARLLSARQAPRRSRESVVPT